MALVTLKSCHAYLKQLENAAELKRKMPASTNSRTLQEGLHEMTHLLGLEEDAFARPEQLAALMGGQRLVMIAGEASVTDFVARVFDGSRLLLTVLIDPTHFATPTGGQAGVSHQQGGALAARASAPAPAEGESLARFPEPAAGPELPLDSLKPLLAGNTPLTCQLFRVLFEHLLVGASLRGRDAGQGQGRRLAGRRRFARRHGSHPVERGPAPGGGDRLFPRPSVGLHHRRSL